MAAKNVDVILGYVDEQITSNNTRSLDFSSNKIGGKPDFYYSDSSIAACLKCKQRMLLVLQIYAPLEGTPYHRTLYIFACCTPECWNRPHGWICLRSQGLAVRISKAPTPSPPNKVTSEKWLSDEDEWDTDEDDGNGNTNVKSSMNCIDNKLLNEGHNSENLNNINANTVSEVARNLELKISLNEDSSNANEPICGAVGAQGTVVSGSEATASLEGPEGDVVAIETPVKPGHDVPALFTEITRINSSEASFISYYISSDFEPPEDTGFSDHERELFLHYAHSKEERDEDGCSAISGQGDCVYEKITACHGDISLHKFQKRIMRSPQQILRYCRDEGATPLWLHPPSHSDIPARCCHCGAKLIFEMQVMPQLINCLKIKGSVGNIICFGTVSIYTCIDSCWKEGDKLKQEAVIVQGEIL